MTGRLKPEHQRALVWSLLATRFMTGRLKPEHQRALVWSIQATLFRNRPAKAGTPTCAGVEPSGDSVYGRGKGVRGEEKVSDTNGVVHGVFALSVLIFLSPAQR